MKIFGKNPQGALLDRILESPHYRQGAFQNVVPTSTLLEGVSFWKLIRDMFTKIPGRFPSQPVPAIKRNLNSHSSGAPLITWFGHSSYHIDLHGKHILVDPVFCGYASPFPFSMKAFPGTNIYGPDDFHEIDLLILTHDHYDHLDYRTLLRLKPKIKQIVCSLGVGQHLDYWGFDRKMITEMDWWESAVISQMRITAVPARHFSGRMFKRGQTLWSAFVIESEGVKIFAGGDSGYGTHFADIAGKFSSFDIALLDCGQYNYKWPSIHMNPEETVQAGIDLKAKTIMPVHWGKFALAFHPWYEPGERFVSEAARKGVDFALPRIGEAVEIGKSTHLQLKWWSELVSID